MAHGNLTFYRYPTPLGPVTIASSERGVCLLSFGEQSVRGGALRPSLLTNQASTELAEYLAGKRRTFAVPVDAPGTDFQRSVWEAVRCIPYGTSLTSTDIARSLGNASLNRRVGAALAKNPVAVLVPAHRVVRANGAPLGAGKTAGRQGKLLEFERLQLARKA